ncbi:hypothetical protein FIBSPDRAFT_935566 [Athelia psychrophila]|uniref:Uncharacterized protein n=1 Tax=Athelia psychrophila TaxID=1759441 RepID=A0A166DJ78_9AGAM|nr:hypothetical protein FIBSPDRAFT_935566 [Fibularhizoctonia sp. CBS 109695]
MGQHLLSIRILFHATFAFVYLPMIGLGFTRGLSSVKLFDWKGLSFVQNHFGGTIAFSALVGLGIFAALTVNQRAFLIIEIIVVVLMPLSIWPTIISSISVVWPKWLEPFIGKYCFDDISSNYSASLFCLAMYAPAWIQISGDEVTSAFVITATVASLSLNAAFLSYICIAAVTDKLRRDNFLPIFPGDPSPSVPGHLRNWYLWGNQRTSTERKAMIGHCAEYIFRNSVFRKHAFEPTIWAIFRGIIAVYSCVGLVVFSAYSAASEVELRGILAVHERIIIPNDALSTIGNSSVASFLIAPSDIKFPVNSETYPLPPTFSGMYWENVMPGFWTSVYPVDFNISWTGEYSLVTWVTSSPGSILDAGAGAGFMNSTQGNSTTPLVLAPFKKYSISLIGIGYIFSDCAFILWIPDFSTSVDSGPGSNTSMATFSFNAFQWQILQRDARPPSIFSSVAHVISQTGGTLSAIDGIFALIFGRTIMAIIFGTRIVSPFGLLGMVTHNHFKELIHKDYPKLQEDIDRRGMAAYISEVAIDAALMDVPPAIRSTGVSPHENEAGDGDSIELRHRQTGSSGSDLESNPLLGRETNHEWLDCRPLP